MARINSYVLRGTIVGALGGLLFGFDTAVIAGTEQQLIQVFSLNDRQLGITVSIALVGTVIGAIFSGELGDKMGGREALRILAACYVISAFGCAFAWSWPALLAFRFIGGLAIGGSSVLGPVYIAEIAPARWRGLLVGTFQINIVIGILVAYLSNYVVSLFGLGMNEWRWELGIAAAPAVLFFVMLFTIPRSARWLVLKHRITEAREVIALLGSEKGGDITLPSLGSGDGGDSIFSFHGRIGRGTFWITWVLMMAAGLVAGLTIVAMRLSNLETLSILVDVVWCIIAVWIGLAMQVKRWHDLNRSGLMVLWNLTLIGAPITFIILACVRGTLGSNEHGDNPSVLHSHPADPDAELKEIVDSIHMEGMSHSEPLFQRKYLRPMFLAATVAGFSQLAGINAILYYSNYIFEKAGFSKSSGLLQSVALGATNLVFTLVAMSLIDKVGRKTLLLIGSVGMAICLGGVGMVFYTGQHQNLLIIFLVAYIACFAISIGAVIWVYISEVFPNRVRSKGQSLGSSVHWIMNAIISGLFPVMAARSRSFPFAFFSAAMVVYFFIVLFTYTETKGITLEEMQHKLGIEY